MLSVVMLSIVMLSVVMLNVIMLSVVMLSVVMPSVIMLNVVVPISMYWFFLSKLNSLANIYGSALALHEEKKVLQFWCRKNKGCS
jgi:hypothetical protein